MMQAAEQAGLRRAIGRIADSVADSRVQIERLRSWAARGK